MRTNLVIGNWKMNTLLDEAINLMIDLKENLPKDKATVVCVPFTHIAVTEEIALETNISIGAQNVSQFEKGAYTGEVSAAMLNSLAVEYCIVGHSERRQHFAESDEVLLQKVKRLLEEGITPVFCCGESLEIREGGSYIQHIIRQLESSVFMLNPEQFDEVIIAYEPIWAIGTGKTASPEQAQEVHRAIREKINEKFGATLAQSTHVLYGGSVKPGNASELFAMPDIDGALVGGASLKAADFTAIVNAGGNAAV